METIRIETADHTFDISRGADGKVYLIIEGIGVFAEEKMTPAEASELGKAFLDAANLDD